MMAAVVAKANYSQESRSRWECKSKQASFTVVLSQYTTAKLMKY